MKGYVVDFVESGLWDLVCRNKYETVLVQVYTHRERMQEAEDAHVFRREVVKYRKFQRGNFPINRLVYPSGPR